MGYFVFKMNYDVNVKSVKRARHTRQYLKVQIRKDLSAEMPILTSHGIDADENGIKDGFNGKFFATKNLTRVWSASSL